VIVMSIIPAIFVTIGGCLAVVFPIEAKTTRIYSRAAVLAQDAISSIKTIHAFGAEKKIVAKYDKFLEEAHVISKPKSVAFGVLFSGQTFFVCETLS
jgi:ATP-binding cassette, subfamily B (MDR/TAP), member 1